MELDNPVYLPANRPLNGVDERRVLMLCSVFVVVGDKTVGRKSPLILSASSS